MQFGIPEPEVRGYGVVRDRDGRPKVDGDPENLPDALKRLLTPEDWAWLKGNK